MKSPSFINTFGAHVCAPYVKSMLRIGLIAALAMLTSGCGLKGDLYLPQKQGPVVVTPAPSDAASSNASSSDASSSISSQ